MFNLNTSWLLAAVALAMFGSGFGCGKPESDATAETSVGAPKNLLLISVDSLRADRVGVYGHTPWFTPNLAVTPELDRLALKSIVFDQAWSSSSWTLPAHTSLFTGLDDLGHGVINEAFIVDPAQQTLAEFLAATGYQCYGVFSGPFLKPRWGFGRGFERYESAMMGPTEVEKQMLEWRENQVEAGLPEPTDEQLALIKRHVTLWDVTSPRVNQKANRVLEQVAQTKQPFFLFLHYYDVHYDYIPERANPALKTLFDPAYTGTMTGQDWHGNPAVRNKIPPFERRINERDLQHVEALYDGEIHWVDTHIGAILDELRRLDLADNTVVAIVSDHGDEFFDHGSIGHRISLFPELNKMVFMLHIPGRTTSPKRSQQMTSMMDVAPTLLEAIGVDDIWTQPMGSSRLSAPPMANAKGVFSHLLVDTPQGLRLIECWRGERFTVMRPFTIDPSAKESIRLVQKLYPDKSPAYYVYDRQQDPNELKPIPPTHTAYLHAVQKMATDFDLQKRQRERVMLSEFELRNAPLAIGSSEKADLQALGYDDGPGDPLHADGEYLPLQPLPTPVVPIRQ
ncbi:MAG: sulfatase [Planctomycetes bacterium]|nr:sulfatase [Planctomycetota bacterium]